MALSIDQFLNQLTGSGLLSAEDVSSVLSSLPIEQRPQDGEALARELVKQKKLTKFQAEQVIAGKGKSLTLGNYVILDKLGQGGMGMVLKAEHKRMKRLVALKVMSPAAIKTPDSLKRFHREVEAAAKLRHPNIVAADDADEAKGTHFLVMEYVDGSDLSALVKKHGPLPVEQAIRCIIQAARGLEYAHEQGIIHRDIKPANLLIDAKGTVKILDMGLARIDGAVGGSSEGAGLTSTGTIMGTVDYMSPEQAMDTKHADARSDIYSLGCSLYYLLTGKVVYDGDTMMKKLMAHQNAPIPSLVDERRRLGLRPDPDGSGTGRDGVPTYEPLDALFRRMVAKRPEDRPQSMTEVIAELERCLSGGSPTVVYERSGSSATNAAASGASGSGNELQDFLRQISGGEPATATFGKASGTAVTPSTAEAETMISSAGDGGTDPRTEQTLTLERSGEPKGVSPRTVRGLTPAGSPSRKLKLLIGSIAAGVVVLLAVVFAVRGKSGTLTLEVNDELIKVTLGDTGRTVQGKTKHTLQVPLGELVLNIQREDLAFKTDPVEVVKGEPASIKVERVGRRVRAMQGSTLLGFKEPSSSTSRVSNEPSPKTLVAIKQRAGKYEVVAPNYQAKVNSDGLLEKLVIDGTTLIETTNFGGGGDFGRMGLGGFVTAKQSDATLVFQQAGDYRLKYEFDAEGFTVRAMVSEAAAKRDAVDMKTYFLFYEVLFSNEARMVRPLDGSDEFPLPANDLATTARFVVDFKNGIELEVSSLPTEAFFNHQRDPYRWSHAYLALDTDNIFRFDIRKPETATAPPLAKTPFDAKQARAHQEAWAKHLGTTVETTNSVGAKMILIPPGEFLMGSTDEQIEAAAKFVLTRSDTPAWRQEVEKAKAGSLKSERPRHRVVITKPFLMGATEVTVAQFRQFADATGYKTDAERFGFADSDGSELKEHLKHTKGRSWRTPRYPTTEGSAAEQISWNDACAYCNWLSAQEKLPQAYQSDGQGGWSVVGKTGGYRLPTEAEWEYACRAGTTSIFWFGDDFQRLSEFSWDSADRSQPVGVKPANPFGLFDMHGNLSEWCHEAYQESWYAESPTEDPIGPVTGFARIVRGSSITGNVLSRGSAVRGSLGRTFRAGYTGFRIVRDGVSPAPPPPAKAPFDAKQARAHQEAWAKHLGTTVETTNSVGAKMILIPPGEFLMGSTDEQVAAALKAAEGINAPTITKELIEKSERPQHKVVITKPFLMSATEVTIGQFKEFAAATKYVTVAEKASQSDAKSQTYLNPGHAVTDESPAAVMTWDDAVAYCQWLSSQEKRTYRLPTEAEWEYACRAGTTTQFSFGDDDNELLKYGWYLKQHRGLSSPVGELLPNPFGLCDMHGYLWEWCGDYWDEKAYETSSPNDPTGPAVGLRRVIRGGTWSDNALCCRSAFRSHANPTARGNAYGFRCVREFESPAPPPAITPFDTVRARAHQEAWAKHLGTTVDTTNSVGAKMILIPPGEFLMGSTDEQVEAALKAANESNAESNVIHQIENAERPLHKVVITKPFLMSATEVTIGQFKKFSATGYLTEAEKVAPGDPNALTYLRPGYAVADDSPAAVITWNDAVAYCKWLSDQEKRIYRLPTEAQWEYACRAGTTTQYAFGDDDNELSKYGWYKKNAAGKAHPVGTRLPNPFGLFDMHGNLWEWCGDYWDEKWYEQALLNDPIGPTAGVLRAIRGGDKGFDASYCRSARRTALAPSDRFANGGFRYVSVLDAKSTTERKEP